MIPAHDNIWYMGKGASEEGAADAEALWGSPLCLRAEQRE